MMKVIKTAINILSKIRLFCLFAVIFSFVNKVDANTDSLKQIWTNIAQPDSMRFKAIKNNYKKELYSQHDSVILLTDYHIELAQQKHSERERATALSTKAIAHMVKGDHVNALTEINKSADIYSVLNDSIRLTSTYLSLIHI